MENREIATTGNKKKKQKKQRILISLEENHQNFIAAVRKREMLAATKVKVGDSEKKVNRNTYNISSIKRVSGGFTFESCKTTPKKCIKKWAASGKLFICHQVDLSLLFFTVLGWGFDCLCWP